MLNIPLIDDALELRVVGGHVQHNGFGSDFGVLNNGTRYGDLNEDTVYGTLRWAPADDLEILLRGSYAHGAGHGSATQLTWIAPNSLAQAEAYNDLNPGAPPGSAFGCFTPGGPLQADCTAASNTALALSAANAPFNGASNTLNLDRASEKSLSLTVNYEINGHLSVKSITGFVRGSRDLSDDIAGSVLPIATSAQSTAEEQFTQEVTLTGDAFENQLRYSAGLYYYVKWARDDQGGLFGRNVLGAGGQFNAHDSDSSIAPYAQATYALTDEINITAGIRETFESESVTGFDYGITGGIASCAAGTDPVTCFASGSGTFSSASYLVEADYKPVPNVMFYAKTSRGFRAGGQQETAPGAPGFGPETLTDYEIGEKADFYDNHLRVNLDAYHSNYDGLQQNIYTVAQNKTVLSSIVNAAAAEVEGFEWQIAAQPVDRLILSVDGAYTYPHYLEFVDAIEGDIKHTRFPNVSRWSYNLGADYSIPFGEDNLDLFLNYHWQSTTTFGAVPTIANVAFQGRIVNGITGQTGYGLLSARVALYLSSVDADVAFWGKNLLDTRYNAWVQDFTGEIGAPSVGFNSATPGAPRTFGIQVTKHF